MVNKKNTKDDDKNKTKNRNAVRGGSGGYGQAIVRYGR
jgi:hypothetical protein